jgi:hypothetical protein
MKWVYQSAINDFWHLVLELAVRNHEPQRLVEVPVVVGHVDGFHHGELGSRARKWPNHHRAQLKLSARANMPNVDFFCSSCWAMSIPTRIHCLQVQLGLACIGSFLISAAFFAVSCKVGGQSDQTAGRPNYNETVF